MSVILNKRWNPSSKQQWLRVLQSKNGNKSFKTINSLVDVDSISNRIRARENSIRYLLMIQYIRMHKYTVDIFEFFSSADAFYKLYLDDNIYSYKMK